MLKKIGGFFRGSRGPECESLPTQAIEIYQPLQPEHVKNMLILGGIDPTEGRVQAYISMAEENLPPDRLADLNMFLASGPDGVGQDYIDSFVAVAILAPLPEPLLEQRGPKVIEAVLKRARERGKYMGTATEWIVRAYYEMPRTKGEVLRLKRKLVGELGFSEQEADDMLPQWMKDLL